MEGTSVALRGYQAGFENLTATSPVEMTIDPTNVKEVDKQMYVTVALRNQFNFIRVLSQNVIYYRPQDKWTYRLLDRPTLIGLVKSAYLSMFHKCEAKKIRECADTVEMLVDEEVEDVNTGVIEITEQLFFDFDTGDLTVEPKKPCFRKLFDTKYESKHVVKIPPLTKEQESTLRSVYNECLRKYDQGDFSEERIECVKTWANGEHDVYLDIMRSMAYCFLKKKPVGSYILIGERRNGKSSFVGLLHTIFGTNNTSMVRLSQLGDPHYANRLRYTIMNAPDEEDEKAVDAQANFKTISDHGLLTLSVMRSNEPIEVQCDFMSFYPMNHTPEWKGMGAAACMTRSLIIPFFADLSKYDKANYNFAKATFTADFMADLLGNVLALATYYTTHELEFSDTMKQEQAIIEEEAESAYIYRERFLRYFDGFETMKILYQDYCNWCKTLDYTIVTRKEFKFIWHEYNRKQVTYREGNRRYAVYRIPAVNKQPLTSDSNFNDIGSLTHLHELNCSVVERLDNLYEETFHKDPSTEDDEDEQTLLKEVEDVFGR